MIYTLKKGNLTAAVDSLGAQLVSLKNEEGFEYIWVGDPKYWGGHAPVLFPIVGALRQGKTQIGDQWYEMGQHGFARRREFTLADQQEDRISFTLKDDAETRKMYPFGFSLTVSYVLEDTGIRTMFTVENTGTETLPYSIGGHPGFNIPVNEQAAFEDYTIVFEKPETQRCPLIDTSCALIDDQNIGFTMEEEKEIPLQHSLFYGDALIFENLRSQKVQVVNKATGKGVEMDFAGFPLFGIWSAKNDGPYVCLEPWTGCATLTSEGDTFVDKKNTTMLPVGEKREYQFSVTLL